MRFIYKGTFSLLAVVDLPREIAVDHLARKVHVVGFARVATTDE